MGPPILKKATDTDPGDATKYGAPDIVKAFDIIDGSHATEKIQADVIETTGPSNVQVDLDSKAPISHTHSFTEITDFNIGVTTNAAVIANTAKVTNATHTGEVIGDQALTVDKSAITGKAAKTTPVSGDHILISDSEDSDNLKKVDVSEIKYTPKTLNTHSNPDKIGGFNLNGSTIGRMNAGNTRYTKIGGVVDWETVENITRFAFRTDVTVIGLLVYIFANSLTNPADFDIMDVGSPRGETLSVPAGATGEFEIIFTTPVTFDDTDRISLRCQTSPGGSTIHAMYSMVLLQ